MGFGRVDTLQAQPELGSVASRVVFADGRTINSAGDMLDASGVPYSSVSSPSDG